ncbi:MAG: Hsp20/alpha crystallin family protein [Planctomycetota bacterium]
MVFPSAASARLMDELASDVGTLFDSFFHDAPGRGKENPASRMAVPMDIEESEDAYTVTLDVPGVALEGIEIEMIEDRLRISGSRGVDHRSEAADAAADREDAGDGDNAHANVSRLLRRERRLGHFERQVELPKPVDADQVSADLADGVLTVHLPKADPEQGKRRIEIRRA